LGGYPQDNPRQCDRAVGFRLAVCILRTLWYQRGGNPNKAGETLDAVARRATVGGGLAVRRRTAARAMAAARRSRAPAEAAAWDHPPPTRFR